MPENEIDEIDVTELIQRIEKLEKENIEIKEKLENQSGKISALDDDIESLVEKIGG